MMSGLNRRQRRILGALGQELAREDPGLAAQFSQASPTVRTRRLPRWDYRLGAAMLLAGVLLLVCGGWYSPTRPHPPSTPAAVPAGYA